MSMRAKFWGVRGSIPAPLTNADVVAMVLQYLKDLRDTLGKAWDGLETQDDISAFFDRYLGALAASPPVLTHGGNTSCVQVNYQRNGVDHNFVLDMGTGLRLLGNSLMKRMFAEKGLDITFLLSHIHWDHIQGLPFFAPLYINKETGIQNRWHFFGGTDWQKRGEIVLQGQMDPPTFPVSWQEIRAITHRIKFHSVYDRMSFTRYGVQVVSRKLNHPQDTFGYRIVSPEGGIIAYTTDQEPYAPNTPAPALVDLARDADIWITDCQYSQDVYNGTKGGVARQGWGHSYPEAVAATAVQAKVRNVLLFHHDPGASADSIDALVDQTQELVKAAGGTTKVSAAYEGLELETA